MIIGEIGETTPTNQSEATTIFINDTMSAINEFVEDLEIIYVKHDCDVLVLDDWVRTGWNNPRKISKPKRGFRQKLLVRYRSQLPYKIRECE